MANTGSNRRPGNDDLLFRMLHAWREDIEEVPFPQFSELLIPRQQVRPTPATGRTQTTL